MSGGIDSSVAVALLKQAGFDVIGVFMRFWAEAGLNAKRENKCCNRDAEGRARKVAAKLGILFYVLNIEKAKKDFIAIASHNLRTPVAAIYGYIELLLRGDTGKLKKEQEETVEKIKKILGK